jgi:uncharacterized protein YcbK (DUF882 family)
VRVLSMSLGNLDVGHRPSLINRIKNTLASTALVAALSFGSLAGLATITDAGGEDRTLALYHVHTGESLTVTYMVNGRYVPSAMKKINYLMRDWRQKSVITIDPETIDLMWELHTDLGSNRPIHIVCGYRSPKTNSFLKRIGRNVAKKSQHMRGKAIDLYFPDVATLKIRNSALVRQVGGVGYYRSSGGPTGFLHIDSGNVRHWGPAISKSQWAQIFRDGKKTIGRRLNAGDQIQVASAEAKTKPKASIESAYEGIDDEMAALSENASKAPPAPIPDTPSAMEKLVGRTVEVPTPAVPVEQVQATADVPADADAPIELAKGYPVPKPRSKPIEILMMAAANMTIEPASAPPPTEIIRTKPSQVADDLGTVEAADTLIDEPVLAPKTNVATKGNYADQLRNGTAKNAPIIKPMMALTGDSEINWWPQLLFSPDKTVRRDGLPSLFGEEIVPVASAQPKAITNTQSSADGKGDLLEVNREGKGNLEPIFLKAASNN